MELSLGDYLHESHNHDLAIRRFCPARMEQEQEGSQSQMQYWEEDGDIVIEMDLQSPSPSEMDQFVNNFINIDQEEQAQSTNSFDENNPINFSPVGDEFDYSGYEDIEILQEEIQQEATLEPVGEGSVRHGVDQGLQLVHLLLACAEAIGCRDLQLVESMLEQIWPSVNPLGDSLQRVAYCFAVGLNLRLSLLHSNPNGLLMDNLNASSVSREEKVEAFHLLHQATPYIAFGFMAANEAICRAASGHDSLHIVDLGMQHTLQWPSLFRALSTRPEGPPKRIRITALTTDQSLPLLQSSVKSMIEEANSAGISQLEFQTITDPPGPSVFTKENLNLREGEALFVNSIMQLHQYVKESRGSLKTILQAIRKLGPVLVTVVEQDANHNGPFFLGRFLESLHYYSAIFDSLEASLPRCSAQRLKIEGGHFAEEIRNIVACEGAERTERHERADQWRRQLGRAGFQAAAGAKGGWSQSQARMTMMVSVYGCDGYTVGSEKGCLLLGWKGRPIMMASAWQVSNNSSTSHPAPVPAPAPSSSISLSSSSS